MIMGTRTIEFALGSRRKNRHGSKPGDVGYDGEFHLVVYHRQVENLPPQSVSGAIGRF
jgi:hypothetical protein